MKASYFITCILGILIALPKNTYAQKTIIISDSLAAHADRLNLTLEARWIKRIQNWQFGDYTVVANKMGHIKRSTISNLLNTKTEKTTHKMFSMVISHTELDTVTVLVEDSSFVIARQEAKLFNETIGSDELLQESRYFKAFITSRQDTNEIWTLLMKVESGPQVEDYDEAFLTYGDRKITLQCASSNGYCHFTDTELFQIPRPARGIEFSEYGKSLCAFQYSVPFGRRGNMVWMDNRLDANMKIILTAAIAAILQNRRQYN